MLLMIELDGHEKGSVPMAFVEVVQCESSRNTVTRKLEARVRTVLEISSGQFFRIKLLHSNGSSWLKAASGEFYFI